MLEYEMIQQLRAAGFPIRHFTPKWAPIEWHHALAYLDENSLPLFIPSVSEFLKEMPDVRVFFSSGANHFYAYDKEKTIYAADMDCETCLAKMYIKLKPIPT